MESTNICILQDRFSAIVREYLFNLSSLANHNHFRAREMRESRTQYYHCKGFPILMENKDNEYIVAEENYLEGSTRTFLINPMMKVLFDHYQLENDWYGGDTFDSNFGAPNREYENGAYLEFIVKFNGKRIGCRYTRNSYSSSEAVIMERDAAYRLQHEPIPGFSLLSPIDEVWAIDWSGISAKDLAAICQKPIGIRSDSRAISVHDFFCEIFPDHVYDLFVLTARNAILEAQKIIALKAVPQLLPNNMLTFKDVAIDGFSRAAVTQNSYQFSGGVNPTAKVLSSADIQAINHAFFGEAYRDAIIGNSDFAKSFITSEYLFKSVSEGLGIDYTAIVVGYLKSVEQLLYLLYLSAFGGSTRMQYWDKCRRSSLNSFDANISKYRIDPYDHDNTRKQEFFYHNICVGDDAMEFGGLALFLRYYDKMWNVSEDGKEYIYACLDDYRDSCRNAHFHKDNISSAEYDTVRRIRNNTHVLLYYLIGGFKLLDARTSVAIQLGIVDYSFDHLYQSIWHGRKKSFWVKIKGGYEGIVCYRNNNDIVSFDENGCLNQASLPFVAFPGISQEDAVATELNTLCNDPNYVAAHTIAITRDTILERLESFAPRRRK